MGRKSDRLDNRSNSFDGSEESSAKTVFRAEIPEDVFDRLMALTAQSGLSHSEVIEKALQKLFRLDFERILRGIIEDLNRR